MSESECCMDSEAVYSAGDVPPFELPDDHLSVLMGFPPLVPGAEVLAAVLFSAKVRAKKRRRRCR